MVSKLIGFCRAEVGQVIAAAACLFLLVWGTACESQVRSILRPDIPVTRAELTIEVESFLALAETRYQELDQKDQLKALFFDKLLLFTQTGAFNPVGIVPTLIGILGVGAIADNVRKRRVIRNNNVTSNGAL